jgi:pyrroline-5-carboxylate reductase
MPEGPQPNTIEVGHSAPSVGRLVHRTAPGPNARRTAESEVDQITEPVNNDCTMTQQLSGKKLAVLGTGKLGGILLRAYLKQGLFAPKHVTATVKHAEKAAALAKELGIKVTTDNRKAVHGADIVVLGLKPQVVGEVLKEIAPELSEKTLVISVAASVPTSYIEQHVGAKVPVIRAMPNTPSTVGCGMTGICGGSHVGAEHLNITRAMFDPVGRTVIVDEKNMDAVTGLSACGPAFIYIILESLAEAGVKVGLSREVSTLLAAQTMKGAASVVLETGDHPALLKDAVTTPAGCTIDGILELEEGKLRVTLIKAVVKATQRAGELLFEK